MVSPRIGTFLRDLPLRKQKTVLALQQLDPNRQCLLIHVLEASDLNNIDNGRGIQF